MDTRGPLVRASYMKDLVAAVHRLPEGGEQILQRVPLEVLQAIDQQISVGWLPAETNYATVHAIAEVLGEEQTEAFFQHLYSHVWETPLYRALAQATLRLRGRDPGACFRLFPRGFGILFRNFGTVRDAGHGEGTQRIRFEDFPLEVFDHEARWLRCAAASHRSVFDWLDVDGEATLADWDPDERWAEFHYRW